MTHFIDGLAEIADRYDLFLLDQFGVLHFGQKAPDSTNEALRFLKEQGKTIVILSNTSKDVVYSAGRLAKWGIKPEEYDLLVTSGEIVRLGVMHRDFAPFNTLPGNKCFFISRAGDYQGFYDLGLEFVDDPALAEFVIMTNCDYQTRPLESYFPILEACRQHDLLMISANPDRVVIEGDQTFYGPGAIASRYEAIGGRVHYIGKPDTAIYDYTLKQLPPVPAKRTIMIGDSMGHDIVGGARMHFATCLTRTGAHAEAFRDHDDQQAVAMLERHYGVSPRYVVPKFAV